MNFHCFLSHIFEKVSFYGLLRYHLESLLVCLLQMCSFSQIGFLSFKFYSLLPMTQLKNHRLVKTKHRYFLLFSFTRYISRICWQSHCSSQLLQQRWLFYGACLQLEAKYLASIHRRSFFLLRFSNFLL